MDWVHEYVPGQVRASCSICGCSRRFPDNLTYCVDKLFRCERCMETTAMELDQRIQAYRMQPDEPDSRVGLTPFDDIPSTFLADAADYRSAVLPGWTPTTTFYDDFTVVPGGVGSSWTVATSGTGTVTQPAANVARFDQPGPTGNAAAYVASVSVPDPTVGRFFMACRAKITTSLPNGLARVGCATTSGASLAAAGINAFGATHYSVSSIGRADTTRELDASRYVTLRVWWKTGGSVFGSIDDSDIVSTRTAFSAARLPYITAQNNAGRLDVTNYVAYT